MRNGFTLFELLIVLAILTVLLGLSITPMQRMYARSQLSGTARMLQGELYNTRLNAMKEGVPYVFHYKEGTSSYEILPKSVWDARVMVATATAPAQNEIPTVRSVGTGMITSAAGSPDSDWTDPASGQAVAQFGYFLKELPHSYIFSMIEWANNPSSGFHSTETVATVRSVGSHSLAQTALDGFADPNAPPAPAWSEPIFFFPNGRTSSGSLTIQTTGKYSYRCELTLRGLTGTTRVGKIELMP